MKEEEYHDYFGYSYINNHTFFFIIVILFTNIFGAIIMTIITTIRGTRYKKMREKISKKLTEYEKEKGLNFSEGDGYTRVCIDKDKKILCIYKNNNIIELNFDNILKVESYNNEVLQVYGNEYYVDSNTRYRDSEIKIYTNTENAVVSLKFVRGEISYKYLEKYILTYFKQAENMINYALFHKTVAKGIEEKNQDFNEIREYKKLLDEGIITQEEFNTKKKQLLN